MLVAAIVWAGFLGTAWFVWPHAYAGLLATKIKTATGEDLDEVLQELARIGPVGIDKLVTLLGGRRGDVRNAAFRVAMSEIERQCRTAYTGAGAVLDRMAASLAEGAAHFDREQLRLASLIADRLLAAKHPADSDDRLRDCQIVIAADIRRRMSEPSPTEGRVGVVSFSAPIEHSVALQRKQGPSADLSLPPIPPLAPQLDSMTSLPNRLDNALTTKAKPIEQRDSDPAIELANDGPPNQPSFDAHEAAVPKKGDTNSPDADNEPVSPPNLRRDRKVNGISAPISVEAPGNIKLDSAPPNRAATLRPSELSRLLDLDARLRADDDTEAAEAQEEMARKDRRGPTETGPRSCGYRPERSP